MTPNLASISRQLEKRRETTDQRLMLHRCDTKRKTTSPSPGSGEADIVEYLDHLTDQRCRYIQAAQVEVSRAGRVVTERRSLVLMPWMADVNPGDLITEVRDREGMKLNDYTLSILAVDKPDTHFEISVEEVGTA